VITLDTQIAIAAAPSAVWAVLTDFTAYAAWNPYIVKVELAGATLTVHAVMVEGQPAVVQQADLISLDYPEMVWAGGLPDRSRFAGDHRFRVELSADGTLFRHSEHFSGSDAQALLDQHRPRIIANFDRFNQALKLRVES